MWLARKHSNKSLTWPYSKQWSRTNTSCQWPDFQVFPQADPGNSEEWNYAETDRKSLHVAFSHLVLCACQTVLPDFSFLIRGSCKWYISGKYRTCLRRAKVICDTLPHQGKACFFKYRETEISSCVWKFSPRHWPFFPC